MVKYIRTHQRLFGIHHIWRIAHEDVEHTKIG